MPKSKKKKKNKDFQKVKLKIGKRLPKADNETITSFKARSIQISEQLKTVTSGPTTRRKLSLTDLLTQLHHYNVSVRHDAVSGLRELLGSETSLLLSHLATIVEKISELFVDKDPVIRQSVIRLLKILLLQISTNQIAPFFPVVSAHLCCAMTHIYDDIRLDSLSVLDLFLEKFPTLVTASSNQILPNFIEQISTQKISGGDKKGRSLSVNPTSKLTSLKWRVKVLERLNKFLSALIANNNTLEITSSVLYGDDVMKWDGSTPITFQPFSPVLRKSWISHSYIIGSEQSRSQRLREGSYDQNELRSFVTTLVPLLLECWVESSPSLSLDSQDRHINGGLVSADALGIMGNVLSVIQLLWRFMDGDNETPDNQTAAWLTQSYRKDFLEYFMSYFPYAVHETRSRKAKKSNPSTDKTVSVSALSVNLAVCDVMSYFLPDSANEYQGDRDWFALITEFLVNTLGEDQLSHGNLKNLVDVVRQILRSRIDVDFSRDLIEQSYILYVRAHPLGFERRLLFEFFTELALQPAWREFDSHPDLEKFLHGLPALLQTVASTNQQVAAQILSTMKIAMAQKKMSLSDTDLKDIFGSGETLLVLLSESNQKNLIDLMYNLPCIGEQELRSLTHMIKSPSLTGELSLYLVQTLFHRFTIDISTNSSGVQFCQVDTFLSFLMTVLLGVSSQDLTCAQNQRPLSGEDGKYVGEYWPLHNVADMSMWQKHKKISQGVLSLLKQFPDLNQIWAVVSNLLESLLIKNQIWDFKTSWALLSTVNALYFPDYPMKQSLTNCIVRLGLSALHAVVGMETETNQLQSNTDWKDFSNHMWKDFIGYLQKSEIGLNMLFSILENSFQKIRGAAKPESAVIMMTLLIKHPDLVPSLGSHVDQINSLVSTVQDSDADLAKKQIWTDFKYHSSLIKLS